MTYKKLVDSGIKRKTLVFILMGLCQFGFVVFDSFSNPIPFYYILFTVAGLAISFIFDAAMKISWSEVDSTVTQNMNLATLVVIILWVIAEILFVPSLFERSMIINTRNVILLMSAGVFLGRTLLMWRGIRRILFTAVATHQAAKD
jgi:hypothetical protein